MSKVFKAIGAIAGIVAMVPGPWQPIAAGVAVAANVAAKVTAKKPPAQGSMTTILIQANAPTPYLMGETYYGGVMRHDVGYGGKVSKVQNPYRAMPIEYSGCGPVESLVGMYADFISIPFSGSAATGYYAGFIYRDFQLGATPEADALTAQWAGMPGWSSAHKLSGKAAIMWSLKFDKDGEKFAGSVPQLGATWRGVKVYDPRLDSTRPGGSGSHRITNETTWTYSQNPALHALTYAYGRYRSGKKIFGIGLPAASILIDNYVAWANVCDANNWKIGGVIFEPGDRWANLKRIMAAGSAEPIFAGGALSVKYDAPRVSLVTITAEDMADSDGRVRAMQTWRDRINTIVPKYRSAAHKWEYVESAAIVGASYLAEDGEEKIDTYQVDLCQDMHQAAQLAAYRLVNGREISPIDITLKPGFRFYRPGDMVTIDIPEMGLADQDCVIIRRVVDPQNFSVQFTLMSETASKHDFALGKTGTAPPTPTLTSPEDKDLVAQTNALGGQATAVAFKRSATQPSTPGDSSGTPATWYADTTSVPAGDDPMWATYGSRDNSISDYIWGAPVPVEAVQLHTWYAYADAPDGSFNFTTGAPGSRTYQGIATGKTTATESANYLDYVWSPYVGPPNFGLANFNSNTVIAGNKLIKVAGGAAWNASVHSTESYTGGASVSFVVDEAVPQDWMVGLNTDPTTDANFTSIDFAIFLRSDGLFQVREGGTAVYTSALTYAVGDVFTVTYNNRTVVYSRNGIAFYVNALAPAGLVLFLDSSLNSANVMFGRILSFTAAGTAGEDGTDGIDGIDGNDGVSPVSAVAIPLNKQFTADSDGTVKAGQLPFNVAISGTKAGASIGGTVSIGTPSGCTATAISGGFTIDTVSADAGFVPWTFTATDGQVVEGKVSFSRQRDPASGGQVSVNFSSTSWWGSGSYGSSGPSTVLPASSTGKLAISGFASFYCSGNGEARLTAKLQYRAVGSGTWIDAGFSSGPGIAIKTADMPGEPGENTPGEVNPTGTLTGLTANGSYEVQMVGSRNASYNAIAAATGFITLAQVL